MPNRVFNPADRPFNSLRGVGIGITAVDDDQRHIGILHKGSFNNDRTQFLHLAWHFDLRNGEPKPYYAWIEVPIPLARARQVAARCRQIVRSNPNGLPYAFSAPNDCFDEQNGIYLLGPNRIGLTCSTFVMAVFLTVGIQLLRVETWPNSRPEDDAWRTKVVDALRRTQASESHIEAVMKEESATRFRPEEVAGSALSKSFPVSFEEITQFGNDIIDKLRVDGLRVHGHQD